MTATHSSDVEVMTAAEVAQLLRIDRKTVYEAAQRGDIPHRRLGRRLLFERGTVLAWLRTDGAIAK